MGFTECLVGSYSFWKQKAFNESWVPHKMIARIQSPSSILTHKQCPRKYFYKYVMKLPTVTSIHAVRGKIIHEVLEEFFDLNVEPINNEHYEFELKVILQNMFKNKWLLNEDLEGLETLLRYGFAFLNGAPYRLCRQAIEIMPDYVSLLPENPKVVVVA